MEYRVATATLKSFSPYSQSRYHEARKVPAKEPPADYDKRTWMYHLHTENDGLDENGDPYQGKEVYISSGAIKNCLTDGAKFLSIKSKGNATYTKNFDAGLVITQQPGFSTGIKVSDVIKSGPEAVFCFANGKSGARVIIQYLRE